MDFTFENKAHIQIQAKTCLSFCHTLHVKPLDIIQNKTRWNIVLDHNSLCHSHQVSFKTTKKKTKLIKIQPLSLKWHKVPNLQKKKSKWILLELKLQNSLHYKISLHSIQVPFSIQDQLCKHPWGHSVSTWFYIFSSCFSHHFPHPWFILENLPWRAFGKLL